MARNRRFTSQKLKSGNEKINSMGVLERGENDAKKDEKACSTDHFSDISVKLNEFNQVNYSSTVNRITTD